MLDTSSAELGIGDASAPVAPPKDQDIQQEALRPYERVPQERVAERVKRIGQFYGLTPERTERVSQTQAYIVTSEELEREVIQDLQEQVEYIASRSWAEEEQSEDPIDREFAAMMKEAGATDIEKAKAKIKEKVTQEVAQVGGICLQKKDGKNLILIHDQNLHPEDSLDHELFHALGARGYGKGGGFTPAYGNKTFFDDNKLNEAATEALRLMVSGETVASLAIGVAENRIPVSYRTNTQQLLALMAITRDRGGKGSGSELLAQCYFHSSIDGRDLQTVFTTKFSERIPEAKRKTFEPLLVKLSL